MEYLSIWFYIFVIVLVGIYYSLPLRMRWVVLLCGSIAFYVIAAGSAGWIFALTIVIGYVSAILIERLKNSDTENAKKVRRAKYALVCAILLVILPWIVCKNSNFIWSGLFRRKQISLIVPLGISFYTLQLVAYLVDVYKGKIRAQKHIGKFALFASFFPQILQGPIPRYEQLGEQLYEGHRFDEEGITKGLHLIVWGFFLKLMIADKAAVVVNTVFGEPMAYAGCYVLVAGILYSIELYTDFLACVSISQGVAALFGIRLTDNFAHPYLALSIRDFWRRWHISLSTWLKDYIYIPLGGSRKGRIRKYLNLFLTFLVSGFWHGSGWNFIAWGAMHGIYQIVGDATSSAKRKLYEKAGMGEESFSVKAIKRVGTFFWVMVAWIMFRADSLKTGLIMIRSMFTTFNPWVIFSDALYGLGLDMKDFTVLLFAILILCIVSMKQEKGSVREWILKQHIVVRWGIYLAAILIIWVFGTYGYGFDAQEFIYGGF